MSQPNPIHIFLVEAEELLVRIEEVVLDLDGQTPDEEAINQLFRAFHTIKGSGSMFGLDAVADFTHHLETALDKVRSGSLSVTSELLELILASKDQIKDLLDGVRRGESLPKDPGRSIILALASLSEGSPTLQAPSPLTSTVVPECKSSSFKSWTIRFRPNRKIFEFGANLLCLLREIQDLGDCAKTVHIEDVPDLCEIHPEDCYLWWEFEVRTDKSLDAIRDIFIFVEDGSEIRIEESTSISSIPRPKERSEDEANPLAETPSEPHKFADQDHTQSSESKASARKTTTQDSGVRVSSEKLDRLVNLVGELVMNQSRLMQAASRFEAPDLAGPVEEIERLISELRENVLGIRMMPIGATFCRFKRLVHDLSAELGKEIALVTEGAETELDKTVLDKLGDPLIHLIRNSIDHGIETAEQRVRSGKPGKGTIRLSAAHTGSNVVVTIEDDGRGLDAKAIHAKALERRLITQDAILSEKEIFNLIFQPGFSTAKQVTKVSGRGVGMDVVKRQIDALRGIVSLSSKAGQGTAISLTLPLTLAIIDGLLVEISGDQFILPMAVVTENVELNRKERFLKNGRNVISVRGELIPYIRLREIFHLGGSEPEIEKIVIVQQEGQHVGIVVDRVLGSHQTVIQSLGKFYRNISLISGATIMGDGRVALILDTSGLIDFVDRIKNSSFESMASCIPTNTLGAAERRL